MDTAATLNYSSKNGTPTICGIEPNGTKHNHSSKNVSLKNLRDQMARLLLQIIRTKAARTPSAVS
jgi:hypothetical protein